MVVPLAASVWMSCGVFDGRDDWIRTSDLTHPKGALYQAEPRPDGTFLSVHEGKGMGDARGCAGDQFFLTDSAADW